MLEADRSSWRLFAFHHLRPENYRRSRLSLDRLPVAIRWAESKDVTTIVLERDDRPPVAPYHHVCSDPDCPGGC